jgi:hypothetical protein
MGEDEKPHLIDFNPRLERHACINGALLNANDAKNVAKDPCTVFQRLRNNETFENVELPLMVDPGIVYMEPMRVLNIGLRPEAEKFINLLRSPKHHWNLHRGDHDLFNLHLVNVNNFLKEWDEMMEKLKRNKN